MKTFLNSRIHIFLIAAFIFVQNLYGQTSTYELLIPPPTSTWQEGGFSAYKTPPFSPSVTSYTEIVSNVAKKRLICAYTYINTSQKRTIGFARWTNTSTDHGGSWSVYGGSLTMPTSCTSMDDPQIMSIGGTKLICVVRAYGTSTMVGSGISELSHSVPLYTAIVLYVSEDGGNSWGYYNGSNTFSTTTGPKFCIISDTTGNATGGITTLEYPRIAFRKGFDTKGFIVWTKKRWDNAIYNNTSTPEELRLGDSKIGIASFSASVNADNGNTASPINQVNSKDGKVYSINTGGVVKNFRYLNISGIGAFSDNLFSPGPERASVAISPDAQAWISYMKVIYNDASTSGVAGGTVAPNAEIEIANITSSIISTASVDSISLSIMDASNTTMNTENIKEYGHSGIVACGVYDKKRGFLYHPDFPASDPEGVHTETSTSLVDIASGPSIQVAMDDPLSCKAYFVGILFADGRDEATSPQRMSTYPYPVSRICFISAKVMTGENAHVWRENLDAGKDNGKSQNSLYLSEDPDESSSDYTCRFFPVLKYVDGNDDYVNNIPFDPTQNLVYSANNINSLPRSFFVAGFMRSYRPTSLSIELSSTSVNHVYSAYYTGTECKVAVAFDNLNFSMKYFNSTTTSENTVSFLKSSELPITSGSAIYNVSYWGSKMDIDASYGDFEVHPVWRRIRDNGSGYNNSSSEPHTENIYSNTGGCILAKPFLIDHAMNDPEAFPVKSVGNARFLATDAGGNLEVVEVNVSSAHPGTNYTSAPRVIFDNSGTGYTSGATATAHLAGTSVASVSLADHGVNYAPGTQLVIDGPGGSGTGAIGHVVFDDPSVGGPISSIVINTNDHGSGYTSAPGMHFTSFGSGERATPTAHLAGTHLASVHVDYGGLNYISAPTVTFEDGGGEDAQATAVVSTRASYSSWSPYAYFDFLSSSTGKFISQPKEMSLIINSYTPPKYLGINSTVRPAYTNQNTFNGSTSIAGIGSLSTTTIPPGVYYADFANTTDFHTLFGDLGSSDQRKFVTAGNCLHGVFERGDKVFYSMSARPPSTYHNNPLWVQPVNISDPLSSGSKQRRPSISIYQQGDGTGYCGRGAIAVVWTEIKDLGSNMSSATIVMRTREFDLCEQNWAAWSDPYIIHEHTYSTADASGDNFHIGSDDNTTAVIAPLTSRDQDPPKSFMNKRSFLLGWTTTWSCPRLLSSGVVDRSGSGSSCGVLSAKLKSGLYSRTWLRKDGSAVSTNNGGWGSSFATGTSPLMKPNSGLLWNPLVETSNCDRMNPISFPTVTPTENKHDTAEFTQEVAFSTDGEGNGIWALTADYRLNDATAPIGSIVANYPTTTLLTPTINTSRTEFGYWKDRNPCITINSSGQKFVSWERMTHFLHPTNIIISEIRIARTFFRIEQSPSTWIGLNGLRDVNVVFKRNTASMAFDYLLNPSITAFPKSRLSQSFSTSFIDEDPGIVELAFWEHSRSERQSDGSILDVVHNNFNLGEYAELQYMAGGLGNWYMKLLLATSTTIGVGTKTQRSVGMYDAGPKFDGATHAPIITHGLNPGVDPGHNWLFGDSYAIGNSVAGSTELSCNDFVSSFVQGSYKGTFDTTLGYEIYSSEFRQRDTAFVKFAWGKVYVGDTTSGLPLRQVIIRQSDRDSGFASRNEMRDSLFQTEIVDWHDDTELRYSRLILLSDSNCIQPGGSLYGSSIYMNYVVELVDADSHIIDTVEKLSFKPYSGKSIVPLTFKLYNYSGHTRNVFLRVRGVVSGFDDADSVTQFSIEYGDSYPSNGDSIIACYKLVQPGLDLSPSDGGLLQVSAVYPNPIRPINNRSAQFFSLYPRGYTVSYELLDVLGEVVSDIITKESTGYWQENLIVVPRTAGVYFLRIHAGSNTKVIPLSSTN